MKRRRRCLEGRFKKEKTDAVWLVLSQYKRLQRGSKKTRKEFFKDKIKRSCRNDSKSLYKTFNYLVASEQKLILPYHENESKLAN